MARAKMPGLQLRGGVWWIWKQVKGYGRIRESTGYRECEYVKAEHVLIKRLSEINDAQRLGIRPQRVFREAGAKFLVENTHLSTIGDIALTLKQLDPYIGHLPLKNIHDGTLAKFIADWRRRGLSNRTINIAIARVRRIVRLAAMRWRDEHNLTWLDVPPLLTMLNGRKRGGKLTHSPGNNSDSSSPSCRDTCTGWRFSRSTPGAGSRKSVA